MPLSLVAATHRKGRIAIAIAVSAAIGGLVYFVQYRREARDEIEPVAVVTLSTDMPNEDEGAATSQYQWKGPGDYPKLLRIPDQDIEAYIQNVGIDQFDRVAVPSNIHLAGWFVNSDKPGQAGLSIINGHVNGPTTNDAIFTRLPKVIIGSKIYVELGEGSILLYEVRAVTEVPTDEASSSLFSQSPAIKSQLNLITCSGAYNEKTKQFDTRTIVIAELINTIPASQR